MNYYFKLQYRRLLRTSSENGSNFYLGLVIICMLFGIGSIALFHYFDWAAIPYLLIQFVLLNTFGSPRNNSILRLLFDTKTHFKIRLIENFIFSMPFIIFLIIFNEPVYASLSFTGPLIFSLSKGLTLQTLTLPTPFPKNPFEFTTGFRLNWLAIVMVTCVSIISIYVDNVNLGIVSVFLSNLVCMRMYAKHEPLEILWLSSEKPPTFLWKKAKTGLAQSLVLTLPFAIVLFYFYPEMWFIIVIAEILGLLYIITSLLSKYAFYPVENNLTGGFLTAFSILLPPALIITLPYLYSSAKSNLKSILQ